MDRYVVVPTYLPWGRAMSRERREQEGIRNEEPASLGAGTEGTEEKNELF